MRRITVTDETTLPFPPAVVWKVLADLESSPSWWEPQVKVRVRQALPEIVGSTLEVRPYGGMSFVCRVTEVVPEATMKMQYFEGVYQGTGHWTLTPTESGTRLSYAIDLQIMSRLLVVLSYVLDLGAIHSKLMSRVFGNLERAIAAVK